MFSKLKLVLGAAALLASGPVPGRAAAAKLEVVVAGLDAGGRLPLSAAFCAPPRVADADHNISPEVTWSKGPEGTRSYALVMTDIDVPQDLTLINKPGVTLSADTPRQPFIHWVLIDIPPSILRLERGVESDGYLPRGRPLGETGHGLRGANVYSFFFPKDSPFAGLRGGYDGPCPPRNDPKPHRYVTRVYALDVPSLGLAGTFFGEAALEHMRGHILAEGSAEATYGMPVPPAP